MGKQWAPKSGGSAPPVEKRHVACGDPPPEKEKLQRPDSRDLPGQREYDELTRELLLAFDGVISPPAQEASQDKPSEEPAARSQQKDPSGGVGGGGPPQFFLRRATCEVFRRRSPPLASRGGDRLVDLRQLSLPE